MSVTRLLSAALVFSFAAAGPARAQEAEALSFVLIGKRDYTTIQHPGKTVIAGSLHGVMRVTAAPEGNALAEGATLHGTCAIFIARSEAELDIHSECTFEDGDGDEVYTTAWRLEGDAAVGGGGDGGFEFAGGTGKYDGMQSQGQCPYTVNYLDDDDVVIVSDCVR